MIKPGLYGGSRRLLRDFTRDFDASCQQAARGEHSVAWVIQHLQTLGYELGEKEWNGWVRLRRGSDSGLLNLTKFDTTRAKALTR